MKPSSDMLAAVSSAVATSVVVSWTLVTFTMQSIHRELDQIHRRMGEAYYSAPVGVDDYSGEEPLFLPDAPEMPVEEPQP